MPSLRTYQVFVSHAWHRSEHYSRVVSWLNDAPNFRWTNLSVPEHNPAQGDDLEYELRNQMRPADVFVILASMYAAHSDWIDFELAFARRIGNPIVGVRPWAAERLPAAIRNAAREVVGWNGASVVNAIRKHAKPSA